MKYIFILFMIGCGSNITPATDVYSTREVSSSYNLTVAPVKQTAVILSYEIEPEVVVKTWYSMEDKMADDAKKLQEAIEKSTQCKCQKGDPLCPCL